MNQRIYSLRKINEFDKPLFNLTKRQKEYIQIRKIRHQGNLETQKGIF